MLKEIEKLYFQGMGIKEAIAQVKKNIKLNNEEEFYYEINRHCEKSGRARKGSDTYRA
jgi:uncharacterized protein YoaH (UPF0181 family)